MASKIILITGANRGIGFAIAQSLAEDPRLTSPTLIIASRSLANSSDAVSTLRAVPSCSAILEAIELDVDSDTSITSAVSSITEKHGRLDVLINNAGISSTASSLRASFGSVLNTNVVSVAVLTTALFPLLRVGSAPRVINVSSARGSLGLVTARVNPPTAQVPYSVSKAALNLLTVELGHANEGEGAGGIEFYAVNPGWCKTGLNGWRGTKEPLEGAKSAVELVIATSGEFKAPGFWEWVDGRMKQIPW